MKRNVTQIPESHQNEWTSQRKFEEAISPWYLPFKWSTKDYGIDGKVEITRFIGESNDTEPLGQYFLVQLKCIEKSPITVKHLGYQIPVKKIIQWHGSNLPVLLTVYNLQSENFYYCWIDDNLINGFDKQNPKWVTNETVTVAIPFTNVISPEKLNEIRDYVYSWKKPARKIIEPGLYFELKENCDKLNFELEKLVTPFNFNSVNGQLEEIKQQINSAIYRISITGPSRSGKSTLINALLHKKDLSPTGLFQTTGVPIQFLPATKEFIQVIYNDKSIGEYKLSSSVIKKFASQDENINNQKKVSLVTIFTRNTQLEKGIALFDIPGLDDPEENIYNNAWMIVQKSNAILYLIDASPAQNGGFVFRAEYKNHILELSKSLDKIFLIFNKVNVLTIDKLELLKQRVEADLKRLQIFDKVAEKIYYISAEESLEKRIKKKRNDDSVSILEKDLWSYLLKENKIGLSRLSSVLASMQESLRIFSGLLQTRQMNFATKKKLLSELNDIDKKFPDLSKLYHEECDKHRNLIITHLENQRSRLLTKLEKQLTEIPSDKELPGSSLIRRYLLHEVNISLASTNHLLENSIIHLNKTIDRWTESNFAQIWNIMAYQHEKRFLNLQELEKIEVPENDYSNSLGVGTFTMLLTAIANPAYAFIAGLTSFLGNLWLTAEERREKRIKKLMNLVTKNSDETFKQMELTYMELFLDLSEKIQINVNEKIKQFMNDLRQQVNSIDIPILASEEERYIQCHHNIKELDQKIIDLNKEIISWNSSI